MKNFTNIDVDFIFEWLLVNNYFTESELLLVIKSFGDNIETYNTICHVRYGYDFDQLYDLDKDLTL